MAPRAPPLHAIGPRRSAHAPSNQPVLDPLGPHPPLLSFRGQQHAASRIGPGFRCLIFLVLLLRIFIFPLFLFFFLFIFFFFIVFFFSFHTIVIGIVFHGFFVCTSTSTFYTSINDISERGCGRFDQQVARQVDPHRSANHPIDGIGDGASTGPKTVHRHPCEKEAGSAQRQPYQKGNGSR